MLSNNKSSYLFASTSTYPSGTPMDISPEDLERNLSSYLFVPPVGSGTSIAITDYVPKSIGGTFDALIGYTTDLTSSIVSNNHITNKKYVDDAIANAIGGGSIDYSLARPYFSSGSSPILTYTSATGVFTLNTDLSLYNNTTSGFITDYTVTESDVTAHQGAIRIYSSQILDFETGLSTNFNTLFDDRFAASSIANLGTKTHSLIFSFFAFFLCFYFSLSSWLVCAIFF